MDETKDWYNYSPQERANIARSRASYKTPFKGKTVAQRQRLSADFASISRPR